MVTAGSAHRIGTFIVNVRAYFTIGTEEATEHRLITYWIDYTVGNSTRSWNICNADEIYSRLYQREDEYSWYIPVLVLELSNAFVSRFVYTSWENVQHQLPRHVAYSFVVTQ